VREKKKWGKFKSFPAHSSVGGGGEKKRKEGEGRRKGGGERMGPPSSTSVYSPQKRGKRREDIRGRRGQPRPFLVTYLP